MRPMGTAAHGTFRGRGLLASSTSRARFAGRVLDDRGHANTRLGQVPEALGFAGPGQLAVSIIRASWVREVVPSFWYTFRRW